jgi:hypothetical protein
MTEDRGQRTDDRGQRTEDIVQMKQLLMKSFCGVQGRGCGAPALLEVVFFLRMFSISSPALVTCTCQLWQKEPLVGGK